MFADTIKSSTEPAASSRRRLNLNREADVRRRLLGALLLAVAGFASGCASVATKQAADSARALASEARTARAPRAY